MHKKEFEALVIFEKSRKSFTQDKLVDQLSIPVKSAKRLINVLEDYGYIQDGAITPLGIAALEPYRVKRAIFLAAGFGSRMVPITFNTPKPLVRVHGTRIIDTLLDAVVAAEIPEIIIVRGYLAEQFDQLTYKYPNIKFVENSAFATTNNISSAVCVRYMFQNAYLLEADLLLSNKNLIQKYQYSSNILGIPVKVTDDWCLYHNGRGFVTKEVVGGRDCHQMVGISYWDATDGAKLASDLDEVFCSPGGKERYWEQVPLKYKKHNYKVAIRECSSNDVTEIDTYEELKQIDKLYAGVSH